ncbi:hypothetical protein RUA4292_00118 [Ruegeria atlantica]|uniref:Uncharacterized protein n=1 Tax=Ruegeria atlantica TaxID=81569 RepID=A0A0P1E9N5_9RHOB|nr:hypothetical protein RUA4292_00118 [Ruegeria atlantica]
MKLFNSIMLAGIAFQMGFPVENTIIVAGVCAAGTVAYWVFIESQGLCHGATDSTQI